MWFRNTEDQKHDQELFSISDQIADEHAFIAFIESLQNRFFYSDNRNRLLQFLGFFETGARQFKSKGIQEKLTALLQSLKDLKSFTSAHFLVFPRNQLEGDTRYSLHPDYFELEINSGSIEEHRFYLDIEEKLRVYTAQFAKCHNAYRKSVRIKLKD